MSKKLTKKEELQKRKESCVKTLLENIVGEDASREGLEDTPKRVAKMYNEIFSGYTGDIKNVFKAVFSSENNEMVVVKDIDFFSTCEHHMVPFFGRVHIGYIPNGKVLGLSKFARLVEIYARRLQIQEQLTFQIADAIEKYLHPTGVAVVIEAQHLCMSMRGVQKLNSKTITSSMRGFFMDEPQTRNEFLHFIK